MGLKWACVFMLSVAGAFAQEPPGSVTGTVVDLTGLGIPGVLATIERPMPMAGATADAAGRFVVDGVPPGTYTLRIQVAGFLAKELEVQIEAGQETSIGRVGLELAPRAPCLGKFNGPLFHEAKLRPGSRSGVSGIALEADTGLAHETITLLAAGTHRLIGTTKTDQSGRFQFADVPPGIYELLISSDGPTLKLKVRRGHELEVRLTWKSWPQGQLCL
jgi:hypothetical protein